MNSYLKNFLENIDLITAEVIETELEVEQLDNNSRNQKNIALKR